ncbi:MAG: hypothetical protein MI723_07090, partial [Caulobacterales bacterium]|nr:hypothetical protein [Caulobacterales bacterium]
MTAIQRTQSNMTRGRWATAAGLAGLLSLIGLAPAAAEVSEETQYIFNTLLFLIGGFLVMWMAAG